jgi:hypothetical protein
MAIVTYHYRPKRAPRKKRPAIASRIVTPAKLKPVKGPVDRLGADTGNSTPGKSGKPVIVEPKRKPRSTMFGPVPDVTEEELQRRGDGADALWRELVRRASGGA